MPSPAPPSVRPPPPSERAHSQELADVRAALARSEAQRKRLELTLTEQAAAHAASEGALRRELEGARASAAVFEQRIGELERRLEAQRELEARLDELEAQALEVVSLRVRNSELEAALAAAASSASVAPPVAVAAPPAVAADDLKRLRGVGPAFERGLRALGITTFAQIAGFTEADIQRVARSLKLKPERILRDDWVGSARSLLASPEKG